MFDCLHRRVVSMWFPRLASDRVLRACPVDAPFALTVHQNNTNRLYCLNDQAEKQGLHRGMPYSDARAYCPDLRSAPADLHASQRFQYTLCRWATRYCPWVGLEGDDGLVLDVTGSTHLFGGEAAMLADMRRRLERLGLEVRIGMADTRGAAWALAHFAQGIAEPQKTLCALQKLPVAALRIDTPTDQALQRLGLRHVGDVVQAARAPLARRFGQSFLMRLDQALGDQPEQISPLKLPPHYGVRLTFPEPIGLVEDMMAATARLLEPLCDKFKSQEVGARVLCLTCRRIDGGNQDVELRLARALRDPLRILPLFERGISEIDSGFGIDQIRLEARQVEHLPFQQISAVSVSNTDGLNDLITRIGARIGLENIHRFLPGDSHIPERSFMIAPAAYSEPETTWHVGRPRPICLFKPEAICGAGSTPPDIFQWRGMRFSCGRVTGPERIAPEWWMADEAWRSGLRDYWKVDTKQGRRLWLFYTPQNPGWFVHGEFV